MGNLFALLLIAVVHGQPITQAIPVKECPSREEGTKIINAVKEQQGAEWAKMVCIKFLPDETPKAAPFQPQGKSV